MARQPTLAEILSDDTGRIREEFGDLLLEPPPRVRAQRRARAVRQAPAHPAPMHPALVLQAQAPPRRLSLGLGWLFIGLIVLFFFSFIGAYNDSSARRARFRESSDQEVHIDPALIEPAPISAPAAYVSQAENAQTVWSVAPINPGNMNRQDSSLRPAPPGPVEREKIARVIGDIVRIRKEPNLDAEIIAKARQNETLKVIGFENGWYQVALPDQTTGYVFGAYAWPRNFDLYPYQVAMLKAGQDKILVKEEAGHPLHYQALWPDGQTTEVPKDDVEIY